MTAAFANRDELAKLIARWNAPRIDDDVLEALGMQFRQLVRGGRLVGTSFAEWLIVRGVGEED